MDSGVIVLARIPLKMDHMKGNLLCGSMTWIFFTADGIPECSSKLLVHFTLAPSFSPPIFNSIYLPTIGLLRLQWGAIQVHRSNLMRFWIWWIVVVAGPKRRKGPAGA